MKTGDEYVLVDTGQVWRVKSRIGDQVVMQWQDTQCTIECSYNNEFINLFDNIPTGKRRTCYYKGKLYGRYKLANEEIAWLYWKDLM